MTKVALMFHSTRINIKLASSRLQASYFLLIRSFLLENFLL